LDNTIYSLAGHNRFYKGVVCVNITDWLGHTDEEHFKSFLNYVSINNDKWLTIFCVHTDSKSDVETVDAVISPNLRLETLTIKFPETDELVALVEKRYIENGFVLTENAKILLGETITEIAKGKYFNGFKTVEQLAKDILFNVLMVELNGNKQISAEMLSGYGKDSNYVKRTKSRAGIKKIGFVSETEEYAR
jgi:hypothetical protein